MSYWVSLRDPVTGRILNMDRLHEMKGGTYILGGTIEAELNITYNYSARFRSAFGDEKGIRCLYGKTGAESIPLLNSAVAKLGDDVDPDYWKAAEGNVKRALLQLLAMAQIRPDGVWRGD